MLQKLEYVVLIAPILDLVPTFNYLTFVFNQFLVHFLWIYFSSYSYNIFKLLLDHVARTNLILVALKVEKINKSVSY